MRRGGVEAREVEARARRRDDRLDRRALPADERAHVCRLHRVALLHLARLWRRRAQREASAERAAGRARSSRSSRSTTCSAASASSVGSCTAPSSWKCSQRESRGRKSARNAATSARSGARRAALVRVERLGVDAPPRERAAVQLQCAEVGAQVVADEERRQRRRRPARAAARRPAASRPPSASVPIRKAGDPLLVVEERLVGREEFRLVGEQVAHAPAAAAVRHRVERRRRVDEGVEDGRDGRLLAQNCSTSPTLTGRRRLSPPRDHLDVDREEPQRRRIAPVDAVPGGLRRALGRLVLQQRREVLGV